MTANWLFYQSSGSTLPFGQVKQRMWMTEGSLLRCFFHLTIDLKWIKGKGEDREENRFILLKVEYFLGLVGKGVFSQSKLEQLLNLFLPPLLKFACGS